jgi:hypothetical protein
MRTMMNQYSEEKELWEIQGDVAPLMMPMMLRHRDQMQNTKEVSM